MKKILFSLVVFALCFGINANAQEQTPDWKKLHYLSEEEMHSPVRNENFVETDPPTGTPRFVAEFEPMQAVMISYAGYYGFGIPVSLIAQLADNCHLYCVVTSSNQSSAQSTMQNGGVNMNNVTFVNAPVDSYWIRDYGPWYIFEDRNPAIVDNKYNRNRPNDDNMSQVFSNFLGLPMYGMNLTHTGGNMMEDGRGHGVSDNLVFSDNSNNEANVRQKMRDYLGIDPYHVTIDPQGDYIAHVDCWGKYLAPDKILIARVPQNNAHYAAYEEVANYFATTNCCWGYPYRVYRVNEPDNQNTQYAYNDTLAPYTNSLILNKTVYVPLGSNSTYNQQALDVYQEALPGYTIVGVANNNSISWQNTDALHCRTRGIMDFGMLFVDHRDVIFGEQDWQDEYPVVSKFIAYSGADLKQDSLLVYYSINGGEYQAAHMTATGEPDEYVGYITGYEGNDTIRYYVFGADESNRRYTQPVFAELDPHMFVVGDHTPVTPTEPTISVNEITIEELGEPVTFTVTNNTANAFEFQGIYEGDGNQYLDMFTSELLPVTLEVGESIDVTVGVNIPLPNKGYIETSIVIESSLGTQSIPVFIDETVIVGVYENLAAGFEVYPNPMNNTLYINGEVQYVTIFNAVGQQVLFVEKMNEINVDDLSEGLYFVSISDKNGNSVVKKIVKK